MTWKDRKVTELKVGDIIQVRRNNARDRIRPSKVISTRMHEGKLQMALNCPKVGNAFWEGITHQIEHNDEHIYFRWED